MLLNRPLRDAEADLASFVGRQEELARLLRAQRAGWSILVLGAPGAGVSSLLAAARHALGRERATTSAFVRAAGITSLSDLVEAIAAEVLGERPRLVRDDSDAVLDGLERLSRAAGSTRRHLVFVDGLADGELAWGLFGRHRDDLWELPLRFVVGGRIEERERYLRAPADAFFESVIALGPLDVDSATELLVRQLSPAAGELELPGRVSPRAFAEEAVEAAPQLLPRALLDIARRSLELGVRPLDVRRLDDDLEAVAETRVGRAAAMLVAEMRTLGPVTASDPRLLERLGWSRSRAAQVLRSLALAGLATTADRSEGPGRPTRFYRLIDSRARELGA